MAESACLQCISWGFNWRNRAFQAFLTPNWHFWQMTQISDKCLLCKTEKTQISGQTQIIWVRWSLCTAQHSWTGQIGGCLCKLGERSLEASMLWTRLVVSAAVLPLSHSLKTVVIHLVWGHPSGGEGEERSDAGLCTPSAVALVVLAQWP